ncbi:Cyclin-dependent kinase regulatory subunit [Ancylostoma duodenale]|uniref:Cyclin-dependent kinases regulatory subunit n=1 Tax=Ancylostoma duodenale TaxID=51022 RepID=A0A0C2HAT9_9BILA|nr:Cyclin-dependent kinase regulatory subunit [Ancylostoma duodenale]
MNSGLNDFYCSNKYENDEYQHRHVPVTNEVAKLIRKNHLMSETEWQSLGIQQSPRWVHYMVHGQNDAFSRFAVLYQVNKASSEGPQESHRPECVKLSTRRL